MTFHDSRLDKAREDSLYEEERLYRDVEAKLTDQVWSCYQPQYLPRHGGDLRLLSFDFNYEPGNPLIQVVNDVIDRKDVDDLVRLASCIREHQPKAVDENREFNQSNSYGGGNNVTFMGQFLQQIMPEFATRMRHVASAAAIHAGWYPHPNHLGIRCAELLQYNGGGELLMHVDEDSIYTLVAMISKPGEDFTGGEFIIIDPTKPQYHNRITSQGKQFGATLFDSNYEHGVDRILSGQRMVFVIEFWHLQDARVIDLRPLPFPYFKTILPKRIDVPQDFYRDIVCGHTGTRKTIECTNNASASIGLQPSILHGDDTASTIIHKLSCQPSNEYLYGSVAFILGISVGIFVATLFWALSFVNKNTSYNSRIQRKTKPSLSVAGTAGSNNRRRRGEENEGAKEEATVTATTAAAETAVEQQQEEEASEDEEEEQDDSAADTSSTGRTPR